MSMSRFFRGALAVALVAATVPAMAQSSPALSAAQVDHLVLLGKVWGFAKYHHPAVTTGKYDWDAKLLEALPTVLRAGDRAAASSAMESWLAAVDVPTCSPCAVPPTDPHLNADVAWIRDRRSIGSLSDLLQRIYTNRRADAAQHYVSFVVGVGNPVFRNEKEYTDSMPSAELRLLAAYRFWSIVEYWFPYRDLLEEKWDEVLREFVPRIWGAATRDDYRLQMMAFIARAKDTHANLWNGLDVRPPRGTHALPVVLRFIENRFVVTGFANDTLAPTTGLQVGDVILRIDAATVDSLATAWRPYYAASNDAARMRDIARSLTRGPAGPVQLTVQRGREMMTIRAERVDLRRLNPRLASVNDRPGDVFQRLTSEVAYLKLSGVSRADAAKYVEQASGAQVLVIDIRNYPREFMVFDLGRRLVDKPTEFARFTVGQAANPGAFTFTPSLQLTPMEPRFTGKVVILVDESSQSQAEYTSMAFRVAPGAIVVGSTTAAADGNVSPIVLPGGLRTMISGIGVFYPDKRPTQRVGIIPDVVVRPSVEGIRAGRDEVLETGVSRALGREFKLPVR